jgi:DNA-binding XRE family transcriptional regulator
MTMQLFEWGMTSKAPRISASTRSVGITDAAHQARNRMLEALSAVPAGLLARGWITAVALGADRLTYDRLDTIALVIREKNGQLRWQASGFDPAPVSPAPADGCAMEVDGIQLRRLRRARGLSQENLAWTAGLGITTVARLESHARAQCRYQTLARLASALGENPAAMTARQP